MPAGRMRAPLRWSYAGLWPLAVGLGWLKFGWASAAPVAILATLPGVILTATGTALWLWPGDRHITHYLALGSVFAVVLAGLLWPWLGLLGGFLLLGGSAWSFLIAGRAALIQGPRPAGVPEPSWRLATWRKAASDEALLGFFVAVAHIPIGKDVARDAHDIHVLQTRAETRAAPPATNWHRAPAPPDKVDFTPARATGCDFEWLSFESGFVADHELPGASRWMAQQSNARMSARVLRHADRPRPWLICIHGYRMGIDSMDLSLFDAPQLHREFGLNLLMPILPLHGPRRAARLSGGGFLDGPMVDLVHAQSQALWDLRRCLAWIRAEQPGADVGVIGYSLGGYNAALLAAFEATLCCVIAAIPVVDIPAAVALQMPLLHRRYIEANGIDLAHLSRLMAPISPLYRPCAVAHARRYIVAATADQLVAPEQPLRLWTHWGEPCMHWYDGSHLSVRRDPGRRRFVENALRENGLAPG